MKNIIKISAIILSVFLIYSCKKDEPAPFNSGTVTDIDGNVYTSVTIGKQVWMVENLKTTRYRNGDLIGTTIPATRDITSEATPKYQWAYDGNENNVPTYGRLYTWYAATDVRNVCPSGWHIPGRIDWDNLEDYLMNNGYCYEDSRNEIGKSIAASADWAASSVPGEIGNDQESNNSSGFTGRPGGYRGLNNTFQGLGESANWCSYYLQSGTTYMYYIGYNYKCLNGTEAHAEFGYSVRCLKDN
jgi:uncharacterized protein (TIGR02145 family)